MKVEFLTGYRGFITEEKYYKAGEVVDLEPGIANYLLDAERVVLVGMHVEATPAATEYAIQHGVNIAKIAGSGADGRILISDVRKHLDD